MTLDRTTGELHDGIDDATAQAMRDVDATITRLDQQIAEASDDLKGLRKARESAVQRLRDLVRGEQVLPL